MRWNWKAWLFVAFIAYCGWHYWKTLPPPVPSGIAAAEDPRQTPVGRPPLLRLRNYQVEALAEFSIKARVLSVEYYDTDRVSEISPMDFILGWGLMSDPDVYSRVKFSQHDRFGFWHTADASIPLRALEQHSANMHMVPANDSVARQLKKIKKEQLIALSGYLIEIRADDGWYWRSSLTRDDTGPGACELVWVDAVDLNPGSDSDHE